MSQDKIIAFDSLRVFAIFSVIVLHASSGIFLDSFPSHNWNMSNIYDSFSRWNVAVFFMISGALFLRSSKELSIKKLYSKNILRIVIVFLFWSFIYAMNIPSVRCNIKYIFLELFSGPYHFWFLKTLIGLYIAIPIYKLIVSNKKMEIYFLILAFIFGIIIPSLFPFARVINEPFEGYLVSVYEDFNIELASTYSFYFVAGHFLIEYPIKNTYKRLLYTLGAISPFIVMFLTYFVSHINSEVLSLFYGNYFICTTLEALAIFVLFINSSKINKYSHYFSKLSNYVLGIYIVHILVMYILSDFGLNPGSYNAAFFIPIYSIIVFAISFIFVALLKRIPYVNKWIV